LVASAASASFNQSGYDIIDISGKHIYPGLIAPDTKLRLEEIAAVRATLDFWETGAINPNVRSLIAYNTDSEVFPIIRAKGVLLAQIVPQGGLISGTSALVGLDAWN
jgi:imidazolonepropionase-like amidohydrolase